MKRKIGPYILLAILILILIFILGVRYGQRVEKTNEMINYALSLPPTKPPVPTASPLEFKTMTIKNCGLTFLYPTTLKATKESSDSAQLTINKKVQLEASCENKSSLTDLLLDIKLASAEIKLQERTIKSKVKKENNRQFYIFQTINPQNGKKITIYVEESLYPLFEKSFQYSN